VKERESHTLKLLRKEIAESADPEERACCSL